MTDEKHKKNLQTTKQEEPRDPLLEALERAKKGNTNEEVEIVKAELADAEAKIKDAETRVAHLTEIGKRAIADMENMRRRAEEDRSRMALFANIELIQNILPALNNAKLAITHTPKDLPRNLNEWVSGVLTIFTQVEQALLKAGLVEIKSLNETFDPKFHEAVMQDKGPKDVVIEVFEPGYMLGSYVVRPAKVKVGMGE